MNGELMRRRGVMRASSRASACEEWIFGGNWDNDDWAGSRQANVGNWDDNSNDWISARGRSDDQTTLGKGLATRKRGPRSPNYARRTLRPRRLHAPHRMLCGAGGQPGHPASANTFHGPAERGVAADVFGGRQSRIEARCFANFSRRDPRQALFNKAFSAPARSFVAKRYRNLIGRITAGDTMREAYRLTARGKRLTPGYLEFKEYDALNLGTLSFDMATGNYVPGAPHEFHIFDPKLRLISALPFRDRVAQQALCLVVAPLLDKAMLPRNFACRPGKGTHAGVRLLQADLRRLGRNGEPVWFLKTDFSRYFASIDRPTLWRMLEAKISCAATRRLIEAMVPRGGVGLPIGSLTSQILANLYGSALDRFLQQEMGESWWYRYMDDLVVLGHDPVHLRALKDAIEGFSRDALGLRFSKWHVAPAARGINFLGYRVWASHKLLRRDSVVRAKRKIRNYLDYGETDRLERFVGSWLGHASHADSRNLVKALGLEGAQ